MPVSEYTIMERVATGSFGIVFKVSRVTDEQVFVMKRIPLLGLTPAQRRDAAQEIVVMRGLHHPCVVSQRDAFLFNEHDLCVVMDYYDGGDMDTRVAAQRELDLYFELDQVMLWFVQLVLGVQYLHANNVIHRDIKTHNVFVRAKDMSVVLGDFGISERLDTDLASRTWLGSATMGDRRRRSSSSVAPGSATANPTPVECPLSAIPSVSHPATPKSEVEAAGALPSPLCDQQAPWASGQWTPELLLHSAQTSRHEGLSPTRHMSFNSYTASSWRPGTSQGRPHVGTDGLGVMEAAMKGTPLYMAPEVLQGGAASRKSDVWSLGCVLYELLALRHPFESRDLAPLVVRVLRGQREPLPSHYPHPISELINRMLCFDADQRPSCEEVLMTPCVRAYVDLWRNLRTPLDTPSSPGESALARQLHAWQASVAAWCERHPDDPRSRPLHYTELKRLLRSPTCGPAEERENVERRVTEAARAALSSAQASGVAGSTSHGTGGGGVQDGTFFYGATGRRLTDVAGGGVRESVHSGGEGAGRGVPSKGLQNNATHSAAPKPGDHAAVSGAGQSGANAAANGLLNRPPPRPSRHPPESTPSPQYPAAEQAIDGVHVGDGSDRRCSERRPTHAIPCEKLPTTRSVTGKSELPPGSWHQPAAHQQGDPAVLHERMIVPKCGPSQGTRVPPIDAAAAVAPTGIPQRPSSHSFLRSSFPASLSRFSSPVHEHHIFTGSVADEDALFFQVYHNVADMRFASLEAIYQAVLYLRERLQHLMRHQRLLADIEALHHDYGSPILRSMPRVLQVLEAAAVTKDSAEGLERASSHPQPSASPEDVFVHMVQQIDQERFRHEQNKYDAEIGGRLRNVSYTKHQPGDFLVAPSSATGEEALRHPSVLSPESKGDAVPSLNSNLVSVPAVHSQSTDPASPLMAAAAHGTCSTSPIFTRLLQRRQPYVDRRNRLSAALTEFFGATTLRAVYSYYRSCALLHRDATVVYRLVPNRQQWTALPSIEELAVLDRQLEVGVINQQVS